MEEKLNEKGLIIILSIIVVILGLGIGMYALLYNDEKMENRIKNDIKNNKEKAEVPRNVENNFERVAISNLNDKLKQLNFNNKTVDSKYEEEWVKVDSKINSGRVTISILFEDTDNIERSYTVDNIENAISIGTGISVQGNGSTRTYILTSDGKVYYVDDEFNSILNNENYKGVIVDTNISGASAIAVVDENFSLSDISGSTEPTVYIKTNDGKIYTDEYLLEVQNGLVEVYEQ